MNIPYSELHAHSCYSVLDGLPTPEEYVIRAKELGLKSMAITDHGTLAGHRDMYKAGIKHDMKIILGVEAYFNPGEVGEKLSKARRDEGENAYHHVILLAKNDNGLRNLNLMSAEAWRTDFYQKPRVAMELLDRYKEDIIVSAACVGGVIGRSIMNDDLEAARDWAIKFKEVMGDDFYGEIHDSDDLIKPGYTKAMLEIMDSLDIPTIITSDCHYAREEDLWLEEALLILNTNPKKNPEYDGSKAQTMSMLEKFNYLYPERRMTFQEVQVYLSSAQTKREKLLRWGIEREDVFHNTVEISEKIGG